MQRQQNNKIVKIRLEVLKNREGKEKLTHHINQNGRKNLRDHVNMWKKRFDENPKIFYDKNTQQIMNRTSSI